MKTCKSSFVSLALSSNSSNDSSWIYFYPLFRLLPIQSLWNLASMLVPISSHITNLTWESNSQFAPQETRAHHDHVQHHNYGRNHRVHTMLMLMPSLALIVVSGNKCKFENHFGLLALPRFSSSTKRTTTTVTIINIDDDTIYCSWCIWPEQENCSASTNSDTKSSSSSDNNKRSRSSSEILLLLVMMLLLVCSDFPGGDCYFALAHTSPVV